MYVVFITARSRAGSVQGRKPTASSNFSLCPPWAPPTGINRPPVRTRAVPQRIAAPLRATNRRRELRVARECLIDVAYDRTSRWPRYRAIHFFGRARVGRHALPEAPINCGRLAVKRGVAGALVVWAHARKWVEIFYVGTMWGQTVTPQPQAVKRCLSQKSRYIWTFVGKEITHFMHCWRKISPQAPYAWWICRVV